MLKHIKQEINEVGNSYSRLRKHLDREGEGVGWANSIVAGAMAPVSYAVDHLTGRYETEESAGSPTPQKPEMASKKSKTKKGKPKKKKTRKPKDVLGKVYGPKLPGGGFIRGGYNPRRRRGGGGRVNMGPRGGYKERTFAAPVAMGRSGTFGTGVTFFQSQRPGCMGLRKSEYLGNICVYQDGAGIPNNLLVLDHQGTGSSLTMDQCVYLMPQNTFYFSTITATLTKMFQRFRIKTRLEFRPSSNTAVNGMLKMYYFQDPFAQWTSAGKTGTYPASGAAATAIMTEQLPVAKAWETSLFKKCKTGWSYWANDQNMLYVGAPTYTAQLNPLSTAAGDGERVAGGVWILTGSNYANVGFNLGFVRYGELWCDIELELCDMLPVITSTADALKNPLATKPLHTKCQECSSIVRQPKSYVQDCETRERLKRLEAAMELKTGTGEEEKREYKPLTERNLPAPGQPLVGQLVKEIESKNETKRSHSKTRTGKSKSIESRPRGETEDDDE
jgi:hypothetical protein